MPHRCRRVKVVALDVSLVAREVLDAPEGREEAVVALQLRHLDVPQTPGRVSHQCELESRRKNIRQYSGRMNILVSTNFVLFLPFDLEKITN